MKRSKEFPQRATLVLETERSASLLDSVLTETEEAIKRTKLAESALRETPSEDSPVERVSVPRRTMFQGRIIRVDLPEIVPADNPDDDVEVTYRVGKVRRVICAICGQPDCFLSHDEPDDNL